jgi:hypothetical protein
LICTAKLNVIGPAFYRPTVVARIAERFVDRVNQLLPWKLPATLESELADAAPSSQKLNFRQRTLGKAILRSGKWVTISYCSILKGSQ